jgi:hypothetical protein
MEARTITEWKAIIRQRYGCEALYITTVYVKKMLPCDPNWNGLVKVFELVGHLQAKRCFVWSYRDNGEVRKMTSPAIAPIVSAEVAVAMTSCR